MSLPGTKRATGTDGNDFEHRERIAEHYRISSETKPRLRLLIYLHFILALLVFVQLITYHLPGLTTRKIPQPDLWQYAWLLTVIPSICGLMSLNRNDVFLLKIFFRGTVTLGLGTIMTTIILHLTDLFNYRTVNPQSPTFHGFPLLILWCVFLIIMVQIHAFSLYLANILLNSWQQYKSKKQK